MTDDDTEFEPTADMYLHDDVDDERTLEEEEAMNGTEEDLDELKKVLYFFPSINNLLCCCHGYRRVIYH